MVASGKRLSERPSAILSEVERRTLRLTGTPPDSELAKRLTQMAALRLLFTTLFLVFVTLVYLRGQTGGFSSLVAFVAVAVAYGLAALYAGLLRRGRLLRGVAYAQIFTDQIIWTSIVFITGGVSSGAVTLYGLTCVAGAIALGGRGAIVALLSGAGCYLVLVTALIQGVLDTPPDQSANLYILSWGAAAYPLFANLFGLSVVSVMAGYLAERLRLAGGELARAEARAEAAERLASLGRLATGLAHEIRNPLGGILGSVELLAESPNLDEEDRRLCHIVEREASRLNDLVGDMLHLSRPRLPAFASINLVATAKDVVELARRSGRGEDVVVRFEGPNALSVRADGAQVRQLLWNLVRNAVQASSAGAEVVVLVESEPDGVQVSVRDSGPGIAAESIERIFDAFFTTRSHGTGVGLAVVKQIVDAHGWSIDVASQDGAVFSVRIPKRDVVEQGSDPAPAPSKPPPSE